MEIGAILAADYTFYFIISRQEKELFLVKSIVQCSDVLIHKISLKLSRK